MAAAEAGVGCFSPGLTFVDGELLLRSDNVAMRDGSEIWQVLEDFTWSGSGKDAVIYSRRQDDAFRKNIYAAIAAWRLGLRSIDRVRREYIEPAFSKSSAGNHDLQQSDLYREVFHRCKQCIDQTLQGFDSELAGGPHFGTFGASIVLERAAHSTLLSAHLLFQLGFRYEGHAVARVLLEQIAWAFSAGDLQSLDEIEALSPTRAISNLKKIFPNAGMLYGQLSKKTHMDYKTHLDFLTIHDDQWHVLVVQHQLLEYAKTIAELSDMLCVVFEITQHDYIPQPKSVIFESRSVKLLENRFVQANTRDLIEKLATTSK